MRSLSAEVALHRIAVVACFLSIGLSCERASSPSGASAEGGSADSAASSPLKTFKEGGTIEFTVQGQAYQAKIIGCYYNNTDEGNPDYVEVTGNGTRIHFANEAKMEDNADGVSDYARIAGKALPLWTELEETMEITLEGRGKYAIGGGSMTLERFEHGIEGQDWWEGRVELSLKTEHGDTPVSGTFKTCIVPLW